MLRSFDNLGIGDVGTMWDITSQLIRVSGRMQYLYESKPAPILLPHNDPVTTLVMTQYHADHLYASVTSTLTKLRRELFWIHKGRQQVKKILRTCVTCTRLFDAPAAPLPLVRIAEQDPFRVTGVDFAGPPYVKSETGSVKVYIALFTCAVTRAVHLELVADMSRATFICALRKFVARRGSPKEIFSDNGLTFKKTATHLAYLKEINVCDFLTQHRIKWHFSASCAPWWGGWWERMVGTVKFLLRKQIRRETLTFLELETLLIEVEAVVNHRPLTYVSGDNDELALLCPEHIITGKRLPAPDFSPENGGSGPLDLARHQTSRKQLIETDRSMRNRLDA